MHGAIDYPIVCSTTDVVARRHAASTPRQRAQGGGGSPRHRKEVRVNQLRHLDDQFLFAVTGFARQTPALHGALYGYAMYGIVLFGILLAAALINVRRGTTRDLAATGWAALAPLLALLLNQPFGQVVHEQRPYATHPQLLRLADATRDFSFPSDHAVMAGAVAAALLLAHRRLGLVACAAALLMAFSRVYIAAHYPWDVLGGLAVGGVVAVVFWVLLRPLLVPVTARLREVPGLRVVFSQRPSPSGTARRPDAAPSS
jgi:undecaprenyl-diphosphatase